MSRSPRGAAALLSAAWAGLGASTLYLLALLLAARRARRDPAPIVNADHSAEVPRLPLVVLVPAHDEEAGIAATVGPLLGSDYPGSARRIVVVADNCSDGTATVAGAAGAEVWERHEPELRGKGHAVAWALKRLFAEGGETAGVVFVDADCLASPNLLASVERRLMAGTQAMQVDYVAGNPEASPAAALRYAAFGVGDTVRFLGKERLGLSVGLVGTGMAFDRGLLNRVPWTATGLVEDGEFHMRLVLEGVRVEFVPEASVSQAVPTSLAAGSSQQARWEMGKAQLVRRWSGRLIAAGLARRDLDRLHAGLEALVPPQSVLAIGNLGSVVAAGLIGSRRLLVLALAGTVGQAAYVLGGLRLIGAPAYVYRSLLSAPLLVANKLVLYGRLARGQGPTAWIRTEREGAAPAGAAVRGVALKIAYLTSAYPAVSHTFILREVEGLRRLGVEVSTFAIRRTAPEQLLAEADREAARTTTAVLPLRLRGMLAHARLALRAPAAYLAGLRAALRLAGPGLRNRLWHLFYFVEAVVLWREFERRRIRHVHVHLANVAADVAMITTEIGAVVDPEHPLSWSFTMHGPTEFYDVRHFHLEDKIRSARFVVCISDFARSQLMGFSDPDLWPRFHVVHVGLPVAEFTRSRIGSPPAADEAKPGTAPVVLYVGRLVPEKGQTVLLEALATLTRQGTDLRLRLAGDGALRAELERRAAKLGVGDRVEFLGAVGQDALHDLYRDAAIFCLPSFAEGVPVVLMEAMAMEVPVVTTAIAGIPELVENDHSGILVRPGRADELAAALGRLAADPDLRRKLAAGGREKVAREFDAERSARQLNEIFARESQPR